MMARFVKLRTNEDHSVDRMGRLNRGARRSEEGAICVCDRHRGLWCGERLADLTCVVGKHHTGEHDFVAVPEHEGMMW